MPHARRWGVRMRRREFITLIGAAVAARPIATHGQQKNSPSDIVPRIGYLAPSLSPEASRLIEAFRKGLHDVGYVEGRNIGFELRSAEGKPDRFPALAAELVALKVDVIVAGATPTVLALKQATRTIPIVFPIHTDPVGAGIVATLARPDGNATGLSYFSPRPHRETVAASQGNRSGGVPNSRPLDFPKCSCSCPAQGSGRRGTGAGSLGSNRGIARCRGS